MPAKPLQGRSTILLIDDEPIARLGVQRIIEQARDLAVCGEAADTADGLAEAERKGPDVAILDIAIEGDYGLEFIQRVKDFTEVLVLSHREETIYAERCLRTGAKGYVSKRESIETIEKAIRTVLSGEVYLSKRINQRLLSRVSRGSEPRDLGAVSALTDRELEVFELLGQGKTTHQAARLLKLSPKTVQSYHANIKKSLRLENNNQLICRAVHYVLEGR